MSCLVNLCEEKNRGDLKRRHMAGVTSLTETHPRGGGPPWPSLLPYKISGVTKDGKGGCQVTKERRDKENEGGTGRTPAKGKERLTPRTPTFGVVKC